MSCEAVWFAVGTVFPIGTDGVGLLFMAIGSGECIGVNYTGYDSGDCGGRRSRWV